jgi:hypothetical protein
MELAMSMIVDAEEEDVIDVAAIVDSAEALVALVDLAEVAAGG